MTSQALISRIHSMLRPIRKDMVNLIYNNPVWQDYRLICIHITPRNTSHMGPVSRRFRKVLAPEKFGIVYSGEPFYSHIINMNRGSLHTRSFKRVRFSFSRYWWAKYWFPRPKSFEAFENRAPGRAKKFLIHLHLKSREVHTSETFCMKKNYLRIKNVYITVLYHMVWNFATTFRVRKLSGPLRNRSQVCYKLIFGVLSKHLDGRPMPLKANLPKQQCSYTKGGEGGNLSGDFF